MAVPSPTSSGSSDSPGDLTTSLIENYKRGVRPVCDSLVYILLEIIFDH